MSHGADHPFYNMSLVQSGPPAPYRGGGEVSLQRWKDECCSVSKHGAVYHNSPIGSGFPLPLPPSISFFPCIFLHCFIYCVAVFVCTVSLTTWSVSSHCPCLVLNVVSTTTVRVPGWYSNANPLPPPALRVSLVSGPLSPRASPGPQLCVTMETACRCSSGGGRCAAAAAGPVHQQMAAALRRLQQDMADVLLRLQALEGRALSRVKTPENTTSITLYLVTSKPMLGHHFHCGVPFNRWVELGTESQLVVIWFLLLASSPGPSRPDQKTSPPWRSNSFK